MSDISKIKSNRILDGFQPGDLCYSLRTEKEGWILCDGSAVSRTDYSDLFEAIGTQYGEGDGTTTFNVPNLSGRFLQMDTSKALGTYVEAGLPNITGSIYRSETQYQDIWDDSLSNGCFKNRISTIGRYSSENTTSYTSKFDGVDFDASLSNSIYGNSTTVQPSSFIVNYFIKY